MYLFRFIEQAQLIQADLAALAKLALLCQAKLFEDMLVLL